MGEIRKRSIGSRISLALVLCALLVVSAGLSLFTGVASADNGPVVADNLTVDNLVANYIDTGGASCDNLTAEVIDAIRLQADELVAPTGAAIHVAAVNSPQWQKDQAAYVCDGLADQIEINQAIASVPSGAWVHLDLGGFSVNDSINTAHNLVLEGEGKGNTIITQADGANIANGIIYANGKFNRGILRELCVEGNAANNPNGTYGVYFRGVWYARVENVYVQHCKKDGFRFSNTSGNIYCGELYIDNCGSSYNGGSGYVLAACGDSYCTDDYAYSNTAAGFQIDGAHNTFVSCHPYYNYGNGMQASQWGWHGAYIDCSLDNNFKNGLSLAGDMNRVVACVAAGNSLAADATYDGIRVGSQWNTLMGNCAFDSTTNKAGRLVQRYGIAEVSISGSTPDYNTYVANMTIPNVTGSMLVVGPHDQVEVNTGFVNDAHGAAVIPVGSTSVTVPHGLSMAPTLVEVTPRNAPTNAIGYWWVDSEDGVTFTVHVQNDPGASGWSLWWRARAW